MANLKDVIYLSNEDYETLVSTGTVTIDGTTLTYDENCVYITPEKLASTTEDGLMSASDKVKLDGLDDSNLVHKTGAETIGGAKTFSDGIEIGDSNYWTILKNSSNYLDIQYNGNNKLQIRPTLCYPSGSFNIGTTASPFNNGHFSGQVYAENTPNEINANDIVGNTLTQTQYDLITNGKRTLIKGTLLGRLNPMLSAPKVSANEVYGTCIGVDTTYGITYIQPYRIVVSTKVIELKNLRILLNVAANQVQLPDNTSILGKGMNYYLNNVYHYATLSGTELKYDEINDISISADTTFTLATAPSSTYPEYKANITNSGANAITITLPVGTIIKTNDEDNIIISNNTFTLPASASVELNYQNGNCIVFNWGA